MVFISYFGLIIYPVIYCRKLDVITYRRFSLTSEHMQLASGFMQLAAAGHRRNIVNFHCFTVFLKEKY